MNNNKNESFMIFSPIGFKKILNSVAKNLHPNKAVEISLKSSLSDNKKPTPSIEKIQEISQNILILSSTDNSYKCYFPDFDRKENSSDYDKVDLATLAVESTATKDNKKVFLNVSEKMIDTMKKYAEKLPNNSKSRKIKFFTNALFLTSNLFKKIDLTTTKTKIINTKTMDFIKINQPNLGLNVLPSKNSNYIIATVEKFNPKKNRELAKKIIDGIAKKDTFVYINNSSEDPLQETPRPNKPK